MFKEEIFHDVKTNEISEDLSMKKLLFTFKSEGKNVSISFVLILEFFSLETLKELIKIFEKLGATDFRIDRSKTDVIVK